MPPVLRYIEAMFDVLVFVYESYWRSDAVPERPQLGRKLAAAGFGQEDIQDALLWLDGLNLAACCAPLGGALATGLAPNPAPDSRTSLRVYSVAEQDHLGSDGLGFICFLESAGVLPPTLREIVLDRALAAPGNPVSLDDLKIILLMVYWRFGAEPDALVLDELCDDRDGRLSH